MGNHGYQTFDREVWQPGGHEIYSEILLEVFLMRQHKLQQSYSGTFSVQERPAKCRRLHQVSEWHQSDQTAA